jgi:hypothetical protein
MDVFLTAHMKPAPDFYAVYESSDAHRLDDKGRSLLMMTLGNKDLPSRYELSNFLLDQGCPLGAPGNGGATVLHVLFGQVKHDVAEDASLARRLIQHGADVNQRDDNDRLPFLEVLNMKYTDEDLAPIYDLWFEQPVLDFTTKSRHGISPIDFAAKMPYRASILARMENYVAANAA